ncbi:MAG: hypothetical protein JXQ29_06145 [Planctomycetes bacterium]|nr:hypothetical protein [Planctomycetota bacterium]
MWMMRTKPLFFLVLGTFAFAAAGPAQVAPKYGDLVVSGFTLTPPFSGVLIVDPATGRTATLRSLTAGAIDQWVGMMEDNRHVGLLTLDPQLRDGRLQQLDPRGALSTLAPIRSTLPVTDPSGALWDPEGRLLIAADDTLFFYDPAAPGSVAPVFRFPTTGANVPLLQAVAVAPGARFHFDENYYALNALPQLGSPTVSAPFLYRFDPVTRRFTTLVANPALTTATSISYRYGVPSPRQRQFLVTRGRAASSLRDLLAVDFQTGVIVTLAPLPLLLPAAHKTTRQRTAWVVGPATAAPSTSLALEVDLATGSIKRTVPLQGPATGFQATGIEIYGTNMLHLRGRALLGDAPLFLSLQTNDAALAGKSYLLGLSFESSPPIQLMVGSTQINLDLAWDTLLWTSLYAPALIGLTGSQGTLDGSGNASASLSLPSGLKTGGLVIYAAWVVYDASGVLRVSETELFVLP